MTTALARQLPTISDASLPASYERARAALQNCQRVDECKDWADKAAALASYAKQADDDSLQKFAVRIQARAIRRCGELLQQFQNPGVRTKPRGDSPPRSQRDAAKNAGMSKDQEKQAVRVANVPQADFDAAVDSNDPPTVTALAERGTEKQSKPTGFAEATKVLGTLKSLEEFCRIHSAEMIVGAVYAHEVAHAVQRIDVIQGWLQTFRAELEKGRCLRH